MKVVLATHRTNQWLGVNKYFYLLGKHLKKLGVEVRIIVDSVEGAKAVGSCDITTDITCLFPTATNPFKTMQYCQNLAKTLNEIDFDILHCGHVLPYYYLKKDIYVKTTRTERMTSYFRYKRKPVVFQPFGNELFTLAGRGLNKWYCKAAQPVLRFCGEQADVLLAEGEFQTEEMKTYYPKAKRIEVLPVGVDYGSYAPKISHNSHGLFQFLAVNSLLPYEGMEDLIWAFKGVKNAKLVIVGSGSEEKKLKGQSKGFNIEFKSNIPERELRTLYRSSDAFVSSTYETDFQMGVLEAMATGLPVLSRRAAWLPSSVIAFEEWIDLAIKMEVLAATLSSERAERAEKGLKEVEQYSFTRIAEEALEIYGSLL